MEAVISVITTFLLIAICYQLIRIKVELEDICYYIRISVNDKVLTDVFSQQEENADAPTQ